MTLSSAQKKDYKRIGHHLKPVVIVSDQGASEGVLSELNRALDDHELIKNKKANPNRSNLVRFKEM